MDDLSRAWAILNLPPGSSAEAVRSSYRELVKSWHPDRFQGDPDRLDEAHEMLQEINWAYNYLRDNVFIDQPPTLDLEANSAHAPAPSEEIEAEPIEKTPSRVAIISIIIILVMAGAGLFFFKSRRAAPRASASQGVQTTTPYPTTSTSAATPDTPPRTTAPEPDRNIINSMIAANNLNVSPSPDGLVLSGNHLEMLQAPRPIRPPFVFRATVKTGEADVRFYYGLGFVILNWVDNPIELRVHDFANSAATGHKRKGSLTANAWHEIVFDVQTNSLTISVDGETRFEGEGFYRYLNSAPGIGPAGGEITVKSVIIEQSPGSELATASVRPRVFVPGDLLPTMIVVNNIRTNADVEGLILTDTERKGGSLHTQQKFRPPLVIRTRAKTDSHNLRLFYGDGVVIFNWEVNPAEMRVHDPATGRVSALAGKGSILPNEWHDIVWEIGRGHMRILLDGQIRFQTRGDYTKLEASAGIGAFLSKLTVSSFVVESK